MKVAIISYGKFHCFELARELLSKNLQVKVYSSYPQFMSQDYGLTGKNYASFFLIQILDRISQRKLSYFFKSLFAYLILKFFLKKYDYFILWSDTPNFLTKEIKKRYKKSIIIIERSSAHIIEQNKLLKNEFKKNNLSFSINKNDINTEIINYELSNFISVPSDFVSRTFIENSIGKEKLFINPLGCDTKMFQKVKKTDKKFRIISCGLASIQKGTPYLVQAIKNLSSKIDIEFWHLGKVSNEIKNLVLDSPENIIFKGGISKDKLYRYYSQGSVFVLPSIQDGFGMVILESMSCGLPVICSENTGIRNILSKDYREGIVFETRDINSLEKAILHLYNNPETLAKMSIDAKKRVDMFFSWENYGVRYIDFLENNLN
jgi:glycosyltransferase involved in cell wall biosynthesis